MSLNEISLGLWEIRPLQVNKGSLASDLSPAKEHTRTELAVEKRKQGQVIEGTSKNYKWL